MTFTPTPEQINVVAAAREDSANLMVKALAGAAKTSTLVLMAEALPATRILSLAFNKSIATEMASRLPENCASSTLNSLGYRAWQTFRLPRLKIDGGKNYKIISGLIKDLPQSDQNICFENFRDLLNAMSEMKTQGVLPATRGVQPLMAMDEYFAASPINFEPVEMNLLAQAMDISHEQAFDSIIDFDDQIAYPTLHSKCTFTKFPLTMVDEAQDLSPLNHVMLHKLVGNNRIIAVGDPNQAIYGFRGADEQSMDNLKRMFSMKVLSLTVSFRCPRAIVEHAQWRAPEMKYPEWAKPGEILYPNTWTVKDIPDGAVILCRNNAPILQTAIRFLLSGRYGKIHGNDIAASIVKTFRKLSKKNDVPQAEVLSRIDKWEARENKRRKDKGVVSDRAECLRIFARQAADLGEAIRMTEKILNANGSVNLMTVHKSKGLEFDEVYILDEHLMRPKGQDLNLRYVAQTRSKNRLTYITSDTFAGDKLEDGE